jgi:hypothetical protein
MAVLFIKQLLLVTSKENYIYLKIINSKQLIFEVTIIADTRNFVLRDENGNEHGVFTGKQPRQAALKAANKGEGTKSKPEIIRLRERGTKKVHIFKAWKQTVKAPENRPGWMPEKINKPFVKKEKIETIE